MPLLREQSCSRHLQHQRSQEVSYYGTSAQTLGIHGGVAQKQGFTALIIGGVADHVHALIALPPTMPLSKAIQFLKGSSSKWINDDMATGGDFAWQEGYGAFSISASHTAHATLGSRGNITRRERLKPSLAFV